MHLPPANSVALLLLWACAVAVPLGAQESISEAIARGTASESDEPADDAAAAAAQPNGESDSQADIATGTSDDEPETEPARAASAGAGATHANADAPSEPTPAPETSSSRPDAAAESHTEADSRQVVFTEAEMEHFRALAAEMAAKRESYIRASEEEEIVLLEPYIVQGDDSLWRARFRRALDQGTGGQPRFFLALAPEVQRELLFARKSQDDFFRPGSPGRPGDAPAFDGINLLSLPQQLKWENLGELFRSPEAPTPE